MADGEVTLQFVRNLAESVGPLILEGFGCGTRCKTGSEAKTKASAADLVTEFDTGVEERLKAMIQEAFPHHAFLCEESATADQRLTDAPTWIIDPVCIGSAAATSAEFLCCYRIDGTTNFVHGLPFTCVSIAFARDKRVLIGVVFSPVTKELFSAERGHGATLNGAPLKASSCTEVGKALACVSFGVSTLRQLTETTDETRLSYLRTFQESVLSNVNFVTTHCRDIRHFGSTALELCYLAAGRLDCVATFGPKEWDMAAGSLILEEAGAVCSDMRGNQPVSSCMGGTCCRSVDCGCHCYNIDVAAYAAAVASIASRLDLSKHQVLAAATPELLKAFAANLKCPC
ncbi:inositol monophosphatase 2 [Cyclospora cayetanensis]|uniref:Inositol-1-monophosphatase n=1 Tax=Cyclospora cayetanensis TaxID=88456 RepID=A0A6P6RXK3_9EIME|nr:inositol monophosphatase 2 [Cyclospora cayetanensis]